MHFQPIVSRLALSRRSLSTTTARWSPRTIAQFLDWNPAEDVPDVEVHGYVRSVRRSKASQFLDIGDGSTRRALQAVVPPAQADRLRVGAAVRLRGSFVHSRGRGQTHELQVDKADVLGPSDAGTYPIQNKFQTAEYLRTIPHLRSRIPSNAALLRFRSEAIALLTQFFSKEGFTQTHPPIITSSDCEGAGEVFSISTDPSEAVGSGPDPAELFFRGPKYLTVSSQLHLEALAQSVGNVWTLSPTFRAEKSDTSRHLSEFYMLEAEMTFVEDMSVVMDLAEDMLRHLATGLYQTSAAQELLAEDPTGLEPRWRGMMSSSAQRWPRISYTDAIELLRAEKDSFEQTPVWGKGLTSEHEKFLAEALGGNDATGFSPVFVTNYPRDIKAFYMRQSSTLGQDRDPQKVPAVDGQGPGDSETVDCFDLLVPELCEIAGGSMREHRLDHLIQAMERQGMATPIVKTPTDEAMTGPRADSSPDSDGTTTLDWYVDLRRWGSPPHGGFGLGFDRLLSYLAGVHSIRDTVAFPRWFGRCDC